MHTHVLEEVLHCFKKKGGHLLLCSRRLWILQRSFAICGKTALQRHLQKNIVSHSDIFHAEYNRKEFFLDVTCHCAPRLQRRC